MSLKWRIFKHHSVYKGLNSDVTLKIYVFFFLFLPTCKFIKANKQLQLR